LKFSDKPKLLFKDDEENSKKLFGYTAHYDPSSSEIVVYTKGRHPKDILRSIAHELIHHHQNLKGEFSGHGGSLGPGYAQKDSHMRNMEKQAYLLGNMFFRDWEDGIKTNNKEITFMIAEDKVRKNIRNALKQALKEERNKEKIADIVRDQIKRTLTEQKQMPQGPDKIKSVQQKLGVTADGRMGPETKAAIKKFQSKNGLTADGILGPKTLKAMHSGSVKKESKDEPTTESKIRTPEHEAHFHSSIFEPKLVALNARLMSDWIRPKKK
jgi:hypothetical protein